MRDHHLKLANQAKRLFAIMAGSLLLVHCYLAYLQQGHVLVPWLLALAMILYASAALTLTSSWSNITVFAEWTFIILLIVFSIIAVVNYQQFYWLFFVPIASFFLLPLRIAVYMTLLLIPLVIYLLLEYSPTFMQAQYFYSFAAIATVSLFLASVKHRTQSLLAPLISKDEETGALLSSRLYGDLQKEIVRAEREGTGLLLMMMDLDQALRQGSKDKHFDLYIKCAEAISSQLRPFDLYFRLQDHRFAIILPHTTTQDALITAKKIVDEMPEVMRKDIMVGYASLNVDDDANSLIEHSYQELRHV
ncbi:diguanylate cyclase [Bermanella marisrubri]|uniref:GGDEF domain protein n=1 Tax=Bermanella marisrubri TaxID=207949 RepID=Q1N075_9GAMM|nr:diguanylate cyclase [Bermanella marisrubri]EAT11642.1 GGDEF domain protein [Oceanobacter sp. RED65] [Bermanella marisrubri]QIZ83317.1 diguanylate cyclase [Bermanella marisrubri]